MLLDLSMPDMDGLQAIPEIREGDPDVAIIVLSGFSADRMSAPALERGADGYVEKGTPIAGAAGHYAARRSPRAAAE